MPEIGVDRGVGQLVAADDGLDVHACAAAEDRLLPSFHYIIIGADEVVLELVDVIFVAGVVDVDEVVGDVYAVEVVVGKVFAGADVHASEHLARVGTNNLAAEAVGQLGGECCFATGCGTRDGEEFSLQRSRVCHAVCRTRIRRIRPGRRG